MRKYDNKTYNSGSKKQLRKMSTMNNAAMTGAAVKKDTTATTYLKIIGIFAALILVTVGAAFGITGKISDHAHTNHFCFLSDALRRKSFIFIWVRFFCFRVFFRYRFKALKIFGKKHQF